MRSINTMEASKLSDHQHAFEKAMSVAFEIFGDDAFRKRYRIEDSRSPINKALFEAISVSLSELSNKDQKKLVDRRIQVKSAFISLMGDRDFDRAISQGTGSVAKVHLRFKKIKELFRGLLDD